MKLLDLLYPPRCVLCGELLPNSEAPICDFCSRWLFRCQMLYRRSKHFSLCVSPLPYEEPLRHSIHQFKFYGKRYYAKTYGPWLAAAIAQESLPYDVITWVPVSRQRYHQRGYDQAEWLAEAAAKELGVTVQRCLKKIHHNPAQSHITDREARAANVKGVYEPVHPNRWSGKRILLIDDIITTGATLEECSRVLLKAGAAMVHCATLAAAN